MSWTHLAAPTDRIEPLLQVVREVGAEALIVLGEDPTADGLAELVEPVGIPVQVREVRGPPVLGIVEAVEGILDEREGAREDLLVNLGGADRERAFGLVTAAFATGLRAVRPTEKGGKELPRLRFGYEVEIGPDERRVLAGFQRLADADEPATLDRLAEGSGLSRAEVFYRVRGGDRCAGLEPMGLATSERAEGSIRLELTPLGSAYLQTLSSEGGLSLEPPKQSPDERGHLSVP